METEKTGDCLQLRNVPDKTCLIINYIPQTMTETRLIEIFRTIGPVKSGRIMYDKETGNSFGYGFITYQTEEDAHMAIQKLNGFEIDNKTLKVSYSRPQSKETRNTGLCVRNLPESYTENDVKSLFQQHGTIIQIRMPKTHPGMAFIIMSSHSEATSARDSLQGLILESTGARSRKGIQIEYIRRDIKHKQSDTHICPSSLSPIDSHASLPFAEAIQFLTCYRNHVLSQANMYSLNSSQQHSVGSTAKRSYNKISKHSCQANLHVDRIETCTNCAPANHSRHNSKRLCINSNVNISKTSANLGLYPPFQYGATIPLPIAYPFVNSVLPPQMISTVENPMTNEISKMCRSMDTETGGFTLYVYGFGPDPDESKVKHLFEDYGEVIRVDIIRNTEGRQCKGYGFVIMRTYEHAFRAKISLDGVIFEDKKLQVRFKT